MIYLRFLKIPPWEYWGPQSFADIKHRFSRSRLGILWVLLTTTTYIVSLSFIFSSVLSNSYSDTVLYIGISIVFWNYINTTIIDCCNSFISNRTNVQNTASPIFCYPFRSIFTNIIYLSINLSIVMIIYGIFGNVSLSGILLFFVGFIICVIMTSIIGLYLAILCVRFRDIPFIAQNVMQMMFFVTPIIWKMEDIEGRYSFLEFNPLYIMIELVRSPLIDARLAATELIYSAATIILSYALFLYFAAKTKNKISYWV